MTVEEIEREIGADADNNGDGELSIDLETFSAFWKKHESRPGTQDSFDVDMHISTDMASQRMTEFDPHHAALCVATFNT